MEDLIKRISASIGVDETVAKAAIGHVLAFLQKGSTGGAGRRSHRQASRLAGGH